MAVPGDDHRSVGEQARVATANATFCATFVEELDRLGVAHAVVCPGSRSTPLALAFAARARTIRLHVHHDERSAGFLALGLAKASGQPVAIVTTSGTAAVELHPAIVEAHHAGVPLLALTADRPPELHGVGAPQTIDQNHLFGGSVRWFGQPGPPDASDPTSWRALAARAVAEALAPGRVPGPVHLNLAFREPLQGTPGSAPASRSTADQAWRRTLPADAVPAPDPDTVVVLADAVADRSGIIVAGAGIADTDGVHLLADALGWPVLADPTSGCRTRQAHVIAHADALLRHPPFAETARPNVVLRLGALPASKVVNQWLGAIDAWQVGVAVGGAVHDPQHSLASIIVAEPGELCRAVAASVVEGRTGQARAADDRSHAAGIWLRRWVRADAHAAEAITAALGGHGEPTEPQIARTVVAAVPEGGNLVVSSSMPIRDVEWFSAPRDDLRVFANRGANGIDGVTSTALGVAMATGRPTALLIGDVAFLHDTNALIGAAGRGADLVVVVVDNDGGGIFELLPQAGHLPRDTFELLFGTPHGVDVGALAEVHGATVARPTTAADVGPAVAGALALGGLHVVVVRTDRRANVAVHAELNNAVAQSLFRSD